MVVPLNVIILCRWIHKILLIFCMLVIFVRIVFRVVRFGNEGMCMSCDEARGCAAFHDSELLGPLTTIFNQWQCQNLPAAGAQPGYKNLDWGTFKKLCVSFLILAHFVRLGTALSNRGMCHGMCSSWPWLRATTVFNYFLKLHSTGKLVGAERLTVLEA